jgi:hypothetical protein
MKRRVTSSRALFNGRDSTAPILKDMECPEDDVVVVSPGPDKKEGTTDDIVVPTEASAPKG